MFNFSMSNFPQPVHNNWANIAAVAMRMAVCQCKNGRQSHASIREMKAQRNLIQSDCPWIEPLLNLFKARYCSLNQRLRFSCLLTFNTEMVEPYLGSQHCSSPQSNTWRWTMYRHGLSFPYCDINCSTTTSFQSIIFLDLSKARLLQRLC